MLLDPVANPDISQSDVYIVDSNIPIVNLIGGYPDTLRYFIFASDSIFESNIDIKLQAGANFLGKVGDTLVLLYDGTDWLEISRSLNPLYAGGDLSDYTMDSGYIFNKINNLENQVIILQQDMDDFGVTKADTTINFDPSMTRDAMQVLIDVVRTTLIDDAKISFVFANGSYSFLEPLNFKNFRGHGKIEIMSASYNTTPSESLNVTIDTIASFNPAFKILDCSCEVTIAGIANYYATLENPLVEDYKGGIIIKNSDRTNISQCNYYSYAPYGSGIYYDNSSGSVQHTFTNSGNIGITANNMSRISVNNCYSNDTNKPQYGISAQKGSEINLWDNHSPSGVVDNTFITDGGRIYS